MKKRISQKTVRPQTSLDIRLKIMKVRKMKEKCIFFAINDAYAFAIGNALIGLKEYNGELLETCDIICYEDRVSELHKSILRKIIPDIIFIPLDETLKLFPQAFLEDRRVSKSRWGIYVLVKLLGFDLIKKYKKALFIDADILIQGSIREIFEKKYISWRKIIAWDATVEYGQFFPEEKKLIGCSGGVILFSEELREYNISMTSLYEAYMIVKDAKRGGLEEAVLIGCVYGNKIPFQELALKYNMPALSKQVDQGIIIHFIDLITKPWENYAMVYAFPQWAENNKAWCEMGGQSPVPADGFVSVRELRDALITREQKLKKQNKELENTIKVKSKRIEELENQLKENGKTPLEMQVAMDNYEKTNAEQQLDDIKKSYSFRIGRAITFLPRKIRDMMK